MTKKEISGASETEPVTDSERWKRFREIVNAARARNANVPQEVIDSTIEEALSEVRAERFNALRADVEAGGRQLEEGKVSEFDPESVKRRSLEKLAALRAAIRDGLESGPAEPFDIEAIIAEARADLPAAIADLKREARASGLTDQEIDAELEAWRKERKPNPSKAP